MGNFDYKSPFVLNAIFVFDKALNKQKMNSIANKCTFVPLTLKYPALIRSLQHVLRFDYIEESAHGRF